MAHLVGQHLHPTGSPMEDLENSVQGRATMSWLRTLSGGTWVDADLAPVVDYLVRSKDVDWSKLL